MIPFPITPGRADSPEALLHRLSAALHAGNQLSLRAAFTVPADSEYLFEMAKSKGGLRELKVGMLPTPPGWNGYGRYWAVFHNHQDLEDHHDPVYRVDLQNGRWQLGREVPESDVDGRIAKIDYQAVLDPSRSKVQVRARVAVHRGRRTPVFRLNDDYRFSPKVAVTGDETRIAVPQPGKLVRVGSLLVPWGRMADSYLFDYGATLKAEHEDRIGPKAAYLTAWWLPSIGRLPHPVSAAIDAPADWTVRAEGDRGQVESRGRRRISHFRCDLPISYPKIVAGKYRKVAEQRVGSDVFRIYQLPPISVKTAAEDLKGMVGAAAFYRQTLGPLPFGGYECYDSDTYYGIESYSHTLLKKGVTTWAIPHEMGHSYFGGLAPCPYVEDSWNEGVTQYIDSVVRSDDLDKSLEQGLQTVTVPVPLSKMPVAWSFNNATYTRGAYVMRMLEDEIGRANVLKGLKAIAFGRRGRNTRWSDLRPYFERAGGVPLDWFWSQWIEGGQFPSLSIEQRENAVTVRQTGTPRLYRLRFRLVSDGERKVVTLSDSEQTYTMASNSPVHLEVFPYTLVKVAEH